MACLICGYEEEKYYMHAGSKICTHCWPDYKYDVVQNLLDKKYSKLAALLQKHLDLLEPTGEN